MKKIMKFILLAFSLVCALCAFAACESGKGGDDQAGPAAHRHVLVHYVKREPTCVLTGSDEYWECAGCKKQFADGAATREVKAEELIRDRLPHTEVADKGFDATCTKAGLTDGKHCSVCKNPLVSQKPIRAKGHTVVVDKGFEASCIEDGKTESKHCSVCKAVVLPQEVIPAKGHNEVIDRAEKATCTEDGKTEGSHCFTCGTVLIEQETIPAKGHRWNENNVCTVCGLGWNATEGLEFMLNDDGESYFVSGMGAASGDIVIPYVYEGKPVTAIGERAFLTKRSLTDISIPDSVVLIGQYAFAGCPNLTRVTIPNSVVSIGDRAFEQCKGLKDVVVSKRAESIGDYAFSNCAITEIAIPDGVKSIGRYAFHLCMKLTKISIPKSVTQIGDFAFKDCTELESITVARGNPKYHSADDCLIETETKTLILGCKSSVIPSDGSVMGIGSYAFYGCKSLTSVKIPNSVTEIKEYAFFRSGITGIVIPNSVTSIGIYSFSACDDLASITVEKGNPKYYSVDDCLIETETKTLVLGCKNSVIPSDGSVKEIGNLAFYGLDSLNFIVIPDSVERVGRYAFEKCNNLTGIEISNSVKSIGQYAFWDCSRLTLITFRGTKAEWKKIEKENDWCAGSGNFTVHCSDGKLDKAGNEIE